MSNGKFRRLFRLDNDRADIERAVDDELQFHFDLTVRDLTAKGVPENEARRQAEARFGDVERTRRGLKAIDRARLNESRRTERWSSVVQDFRYAVRGLARKPGFAIAVVVILALGIGANATMFGIVDQLFLRPPALLSAPDRVHRVYLARTNDGKEYFGPVSSYLRFADITDSARTIDAAVAFRSQTLAIGRENAKEEKIVYASSGIWKMFDARPNAGRFYTASEDIPKSPTNVVVLSYGYWQRVFGGDAGVIGKSLRIGRLDYTVIGVAPRGFAAFSRQNPVAFLPLASGALNSFPGNGRVHWYDSYGFNWLQIFVQRKAGVTPEAAAIELDTRFRQSYQSELARSPQTTPIAEAKPHAVIAPVQAERGPNQGTDVKVAVWLVGVAVIVLLIACANVTNLMLARALRRQREIAVRLALGISRSRLVAQLLVESTLLALLGGAAGLAVAEWGGSILRATLVPDIASVSAFSDARTLLFTLGVVLLVGVATGLLAAWRSGNTSLSAALKSGSREGTHQRSRLRSSLLVAQAALSVVLLVGAGLFVRSLHNVQSIRMGFDSDQIAWLEPNMRDVTLEPAREAALMDEMQRAAREVPGVQQAATAAMVPLVSNWEEPLFVAGIDSVNKRGSFLLQVVSPEYFQTMGTRIVRGRALAESDKVGTEPVMVVSQSMARNLWPNAEALDKCVRVGADTAPCRRVVGVAEDLHWESLINDKALQLYMPRTQFEMGRGVVFVRLQAATVKSLESVRAAVQRAMPGTSYVTVQTMSDALGVEQRSWQLGATMFAIFGGLALIVASIGLYSVISYSVTQRTQEMGVRMALGARAADVVRMILRQSMSLSLFAVVLGVGVSLLAGQWIKPLLFETSAYDPAVYAGVTVVLVVVAVVAALAPALRASRVDPVEALRDQ